MNYPNNSESAGTSAEPIIEWETKGIYVEAGTKLNKISMIGRVNNTEVTDLKYRIFFKTDKVNHYTTDGVNSDTDLDNTLL